MDFRAAALCGVGSCGAHQQVMGGAAGPAISPLAIADFKNGSYSIGSFSKTLAEQWTDSSTIPVWNEQYNFVANVITPDVGLIIEGLSSAAVMGMVATAELFSALDPNNGLCFVVNYIRTELDNLAWSAIGVAADNFAEGWDKGWYFSSTTHGANDATVGDYASSGVSDTADTINGFNRAANLWLPSALKFSVNATEVVTKATPQAPDFSQLFIELSLNGALPAANTKAVIEKITFYDPADVPDDAALMALSS